MRSKKILVTGASGAIGSGIVQELLKDSSVQIFAQYSSRSPNFQGDRLRWVQADFSDSNATETWIQRLTDEVGGFDGLVHAAGVLIDTSNGFLDLERKNLEKTFQVNLIAPMLILKHVLPRMMSSGFGRVVSLSSVGVKFGGSPTAPAYSISKIGIEHLTKTLVKASASAGVASFAVRVGVVDSEMQKKRYQNNPQGFQKRIELIPQKKPVTVEEVAQVVKYLLFEAPHAMTGSVLDVAGGE